MTGMHARMTLAAAIVSTLSPSVASSQPHIVEIGTLPGAGFTHGHAVSAHGSAVAGTSGSAIFSRAFRWTPAGGMQALAPLPGGLDSYAYAISGDGAVVAGGSAISGGATRAARWMPGGSGGAEDLGVLPGGNDSTALAASADGAIVTGWSDSFAGHRAFRWTAASGMVDLGTLPGGSSSFAQAVSADGAIIVGSSGSHSGDRAFRWIAGVGMQDIGTLPGHNYSHGRATSADGSVVAGESGVAFTFPPPPELPLRAFRWTAAGIEDLGLLPGGTYARAHAISGNGLVVAGTADAQASGGGAAGERAFLWTAALGMVDLNTYLPVLGVNLDGWTLTDAYALNGDGSVIVGHGFFQGAHVTWVAVVAACYANCDGSTVEPLLNVDDFTCFINEFAAAQSLSHQQQLDHYANCDHSTTAPVLNVDDFTCFINAFAAGCP